MTTASVFDIHFLVGTISKNLAPRDIRQCTLVCHVWYARFSPFLWSNIRILQKLACDRFHYFEAQTALVRYAHNVRSVHSFWPRAEATLAAIAINNLTILKISSTGFVPAFVDLFSRSHNLRLLDMTCLLQDKTVAERFISVLRNHHQLQELRMRLFNTPRPITRRILLSCGNLDKILVKVSMGNSEVPELTMGNVDGPVRTHENVLAEMVELAGSESPSFKVRDLEINSGIMLGDPLFLLLRLCPDIERFTAPSSYYWSQILTDAVSEMVTELALRMRSTMKKLRHLDMGVSDMHGQYAADIIEACSGLVSYIGLHDQRELQIAISTLQSMHRDTLTVVDLCASGLVWTAEGVLQSFLCACPSLSSFSAMGPLDPRKTRPYKGYFVPDKQRQQEATQRSSSSLWMCKGLKELKLTFKSRCWSVRPRELREAEYEQGSVHDLDSQVEYVPVSLIEQLGSLTMLQELWLGRVTSLPEGAEYTFWDLTEEQVGTGQKQASQLLATLSTLPWIRRLEFQGLREVMNDDEIEDAKQFWKHVIAVK
ncbi:hypothetical protein BG003_002993 [Podila horticola]|nr:hypothetical protein BG003_002993 [Podila horticola]